MQLLSFASFLSSTQQDSELLFKDDLLQSCQFYLTNNIYVVRRCFEGLYPSLKDLWLLYALFIRKIPCENSRPEEFRFFKTDETDKTDKTDNTCYMHLWRRFFPGENVADFWRYVGVYTFTWQSAKKEKRFCRGRGEETKVVVPSLCLSPREPEQRVENLLKKV